MFGKATLALLVGSVLIALPIAVPAQSKGGSTPTAAGTTVSADRLITRYTGLAGSVANATALVNGLRYGTPFTVITLQTITTTTCTTTPATTPPPPPPLKSGPGGGLLPPPPPPGTGTGGTTACTDTTTQTEVPVSITPPTGNMGFGNVDIALALTEALMKDKKQSLKDALMSVLNKRALDKMGWPEIAESFGYKLSEVSN